MKPEYKDGIISYPKRFSEAEIQSLLWFKLREIGIDARLEVKAKLNCRLHRLDVVVFKDENPQSIIECKAYTHNYNPERLAKLSDSKQLNKYQEWGLPVFLCLYEREIKKTVQLIKKSLETEPFIRIE